MRFPPVDASSSTYLAYASYVEGALEGWSQADSITDEQGRVIEQVRQKIIPLVEDLHRKAVAAEAARRATRRARARYSVSDVLLDQRVMATSDAVLNGPAARSRQHAVYQQIFQGVTPGQIADTHPREEPEVVVRLRDRLATAPDFPEKKKLYEDLGVALERSFAARDTLKGAAMVEARAVDEERAARLALRQGIDEAYGSLRAAFAGHRTLVESFFPKDRGTTKASKGEGTAKAPEPEDAS